MDASRQREIELHDRRLQSDDALQVRVAGAEVIHDQQRAGAATELIEHAGAQLVVRERIVIVARSVVVRYTLTAIQWLQPPRCAVDLVASEGEALEELERAKAGRAAKARAILAELRAHSSATPARAPST
ncbi:MAG TPA: hypothetical protein VIJ33_06505 [Solirubrobacteraceae bacterium]